METRFCYQIRLINNSMGRVRTLAGRGVVYLRQFSANWRSGVYDPNYHALGLAILACILLFANLQKGDLSGYDDAVYAHEAKGVLQTGDWFTLRLNGKADFDKPPLFVWMIALSFKLIGISDYAAKFPAALFGLATILLMYVLTKELFKDRWLPILAMLVLMTTQYFLKYSMHAMTEAPFTFFFCLAIYFYLKARKQPYFLLLCGLAVGLATLSRSPMGLFPLGIISLHLIFTKRFDLFLSRYWAGCLIWSVLLPMCWYVREYWLYGNEFLTQHFANVLNHAASTQKTDFGQQVVWLFEYPILLFKHYWPWLPFMAVGLCGALKRTIREKDAPSALLVLWVLGIVIPFSLADSKVLRYILPAFPAFSVLAATALDSWIACRRKTFFKWSYTVVTLVVLVATLFPNYKVRAGNMRALAPVVQATTRPKQQVLLYTAGEYKWDYRNKLLWYGDRMTWHALDLGQVGALLRCDLSNVAIVNRGSLAGLAEKMNGQVQVIAESESFVCVRSL